MAVELREVAHGTPDYGKLVALRDLVLRMPLGLRLEPEELVGEDMHHHLSLWKDGAPVACLILSAVEDPQEFRLRQMAVHPDEQGKGYGAQLVRYAETVARRHGKTGMLLYARVAALGFYRSLGYREEGEVFTDKTLPHQVMRRNILETAHSADT